MIVKIIKLELYPLENPTGYAVGFDVTCSNGRNFYKDIVVALEDVNNKTDQEIADYAWTLVKTEVETKAEYLETLSPIIGTELIIHDEAPIDEEEPIV